jgi:hypothetical protein
MGPVQVWGFGNQGNKIKHQIEIKLNLTLDWQSLQSITILVPYMINISTSCFYELKCTYIAVTDTFAGTKPTPLASSFAISGVFNVDTSSLL